MSLPSLDEGKLFVKAMYYGGPGSGKTTASAHMARLGKVIAVDAEAGIKARPLRLLGVPTGDIHPYRIENYADLDKLYWQVKAMLDDDPDSIAGVTFDSMTEIQKKLIESIVGERHAKATRLAEAGGFAVKDDEFATDRDEYGKMTEMVRRISRRFRDLPCHVVFVCLAKRDVDAEGGGIVYRPALTPAFQNDLMGYVDMIAYTTQVDVEDPNDRSQYLGVMRPIGKFQGKDRFGATPRVLANPTFDRLVKYVESENGEMDGDPYQAAYNSRMAARADSEPPAPEPEEQAKAE